VLSKDEWKVLWASTERNMSLPKTALFAHWAFYAIAKLSPGWGTVWHGWFRLQERLEGYQLSKSALTEL
jgi:hypothetical protein